MSKVADLDRRSRSALLTNMRQELLAPVAAVTEYGELLREAAARASLEEVLPDLDRILSAASDLSGLADRLLDPGISAEIFDWADLEGTEKVLRHDLRTPINAIKGYSEMLLEDLGDMGAEELRADFEKLLAEANRLLANLDGIISFSRGGIDDVESSSDVMAAVVAMSELASPREGPEGPLPEEETGTILVVDDIESNRDLLARRLIRDGHKVETAASGVEALQRLLEDDFDLVLLDLMMPGMSGYEVLERLKNDAWLRQIPVIMVSALNETESVIRCIQAGADDYLPKPINPTLLRARIRTGLEKKHTLDQERQNKVFIRRAFARFLSPAVVDELASDPSKLSLGGERVEVTCLFTDLEGFTTLIESHEPARALPVLNRYLDGLCRITLEHGGTIDKIVGDALHAFFGAPVKQPDHPNMALKCALALDAYAEAFRSEGEAEALELGVTRIGVHTGLAVVGNFGGDTFFDYTAHGDSVNTTARVESVNKHLGTRICVTETTASRCPDASFRPAGNLVFKGKSQGVECFHPVTPDDTDAASMQSYGEAFALMRDGDPAAPEVFRKLAEKNPDDPLVTFHARRLAAGEIGAGVVFDNK